MKKMVLATLMMVCLPVLAMAQDDLYFVPKKKTESKVTKSTSAKAVEKTQPTTVYTTSTNTTVVVKDAAGDVRDLDEYNRRYTSRENTFSMENDTLYIEEKPYNEQGEWVNGFEGTQDDYEYAMRIVRFRNPRYAIPVSSPLYWDVVYGLPSWDWNVYDDGMYAYVFPTFTNRLWWDWRWNSFSYGWGYSYSPWWSWYSPGYWYGGHWGGHWGGHRGGHWGHPHWAHHHHGPMHAGWGGYWGSHGRFGSTAHHPGIHAGRYANKPGIGATRNTGVDNRRGSVATNRRASTVTGRTARGDKAVGTRQSVRTSTRNQSDGRQTRVGRVVTSGNSSNSVRPQRSTAVRTRSGEAVSTREAAGVRSSNTYTRSTQSRGSSYNRPSSTRSSVTNRSASSYQKKSDASVRSRSNSGPTYRSSSSDRSSSRSSYSSGGGSSRSSAGGGGGSSRSGGGGSRGGGRR